MHLTTLTRTHSMTSNNTLYTGLTGPIQKSGHVHLAIFHCVAMQVMAGIHGWLLNAHRHDVCVLQFPIPRQQRIIMADKEAALKFSLMEMDIPSTASTGAGAVMSQHSEYAS